MDEMIIPGLGEDRRAVQQFLATGGAPAFAVRAQRVQEAFDALVGEARRQRQELLALARTRLGTLHALAGSWDALRPYLRDEVQQDVLEMLHAELKPDLAEPPGKTSSPRALRRALAEVVESLEWFNRRWQERLEGLDLTRVNLLREGYNRYYVLEKECLLRSPRLARQGFRPLAPITTADLAALLPPLPVPALA